MADNKNMTIEEMIAAGASWGEISARVKALQKEQAEKEKAERMAQEQKAKRHEAISIARSRLIAAIADWLIAEGLIDAEERDDFIKDIIPTINALAEETKAMFVLNNIFNKR